MRLKNTIAAACLFILPCGLLASIMSITPGTASLALTVSTTGTPVEYTITNTSTNQASIPGPFAITYFPNNESATNYVNVRTVTHSPSKDDCTQVTSLAYGSSCYFNFTITGTAATTSAIVMRPKVCGYHGSGPCEISTAAHPLSISVSGTPTPPPPPPVEGQRTFTIKNLCPFRVSFGFVSGSVQAPLIPSSGGTSCSKTNSCASPAVCAYASATATEGVCSAMKDIYCNPTYYNAHTAECDSTSGTQVCGACPSGSSCNTTAGNLIGGVSTGLCFNSAPTVTSPSDGNQVLESGGEAIAQLIPSLATVDVKWSGGVFPRVIPKIGTATTIAGWCRADKDATKPCDLGQGPQPPYTGAEFTLLHDGQDSYDTTLIDGPTIPVQMAPTSIARDSANPYLCGTPGAVVAQTGSTYNLPASTWSFSSPNNDPGYNFVHLTSASVACTSDSVCTGASVGGTTCGMGYDSTGAIAATATPHCGTLLGRWAGAKACSFNNDYENTLFACNTPYQGIVAGTYDDLYKCTGAAPASCYQDGAEESCCGCENWTNTEGTETCKAQNPTWLSGLLNNISWLKNASPTSYSFPYDDASSSFTCPATGTSADIGSVAYTVTFCPGGNTGGITPPVTDLG